MGKGPGRTIVGGSPGQKKTKSSTHLNEKEIIENEEIDESDDHI